MRNSEFSERQIFRGQFSCAEDTTPNNPAMRFGHPVYVANSSEVSANPAPAGRASLAVNAAKSAPKLVLERLESLGYFSATGRSIASPYRPKYHEHFMFAPKPIAPVIRSLRLPLLARMVAALF